MPHSWRNRLDDMIGALCLLRELQDLPRARRRVPPIGLSQNVGSPRCSAGATRSKWSSPKPEASPSQTASTCSTISSSDFAAFTPGNASVNGPIAFGSAS